MTWETGLRAAKAQSSWEVTSGGIRRRERVRGQPRGGGPQAQHAAFIRVVAFVDHQQRLRPAFQRGGLPVEARISRLARWVDEAERRGKRYRLRLPGESLGPAQGPAHRHACLRTLALLPHAPA